MYREALILHWIHFILGLTESLMFRSQYTARFVLISRLILLIYALAIGWSIYKFVILPSGLFAWDPAGHATRALIFTQDINQGDWLGFLYDTYRQVYWPPIHPLLIGVAFSIGGTTTVVARLPSLLMFLATALVIYPAGWRIGQRLSYLVAFISTFLFLSSSALIPFASDAMLEMTALFFFTLAILFFLKIDEGSHPMTYFGLGLCIVATYFAKVNFGILLMLALGIELLIEARFRPRKLLSRSMLYLLLPIVIAFLLWFAYPPKLIKTWETLINQPFGTADAFSIEGLLFYPRKFITVSGGIVFTILFGAAFLIVVFKYHTNRKLRFLILLIVAQFLIGELHQTKVTRHLLPILPPLFMITSYVMAFEAFGTNSKWRNSLGWIATIFLFVSSSVLLFTDLKPISSNFNRRVIEYISDLVAEDKSTLILGTINVKNPSPPLLDWSLIADEDVMLGIHSDIIMNYEQDKSFLSFIDKIPLPSMVSERLRTVASRSEQSNTTRSLYLGITDTSYSQNEESLYRSIKEMSNQSLFDKVILVTPVNLQDSYVPIGQSPYPLDFITPSLKRLGLVRTSTQVFETENTRIDIYE